MEMPMDLHNQAMGYDRTATMFSPEGHLLQVEYAEKTVRLGSTSIGITCKDGVLIIADRRIKDKLIIPESANKIFEVDNHIAISAAGILSDARILIERAQLIGQQHRVTYDSPIETELIIKEIANIKQQSTQYGGVRPFGVSIIVAGIDNKPRLFVSDVTGNYFEYKATAIGEHDEKIKEILRKEYKEDIGIDAGIKLAVKIMKNVLGKNFDLDKIDVAYIKTKEKKLERVSKEELKKYNK